MGSSKSKERGAQEHNQDNMEAVGGAKLTACGGPASEYGVDI